MSSSRSRTVALLGGVSASLVLFRGPLIRELVEHGHRVLAMAPHDERWTRRVSDLGADYVRVEFARASIDPLGDMRARRSIRRVLEANSVDVLLAYTIKPVVYGVPAAKRAGVPIRVALITGLGYAFGSETRHQRLTGIVARHLYRSALGQATAVRFQNPDDRNLFVEGRLVRPDVTDVVAGSGVDLDFYERAEPPRTNSVRFLLIARLLADKGIREFVEAARAVRRVRPETTFQVLGPKDPNPLAIDSRDLEDWIAEGIVEFHPPTSDVRLHLAACDVYVLPSYREGTPRTVLEAMAIGRPIITTDAPGCRETTVDGDNGFLVPVGDARTLADAMIRLVDDHPLRVRMGRRSRQIVEAKYDVRLVNRDMMRAMGLGHQV